MEYSEDLYPLYKNNLFDFLRFSLENRSIVSSSPASSFLYKLDWKELIKWAQTQTIIGVLFEGLQHLGSDSSTKNEENTDRKNTIPCDVLLEWVAFANQIEQRNHLVNNACMELIASLNEDGYDCCILKGQGNAMLYPNPFSRTPGDIDIWVKLTDENDNGKNLDRIDRVIAYSKKKNPKGIADINHVDYGFFCGVEVELHYRPTYMNSPFFNKRLHKWIRRQEKSVFSNKIKLPDGEGELNVPTAEFNIVYQLCHMYKHVISEGIGLRQMIDYYYLLKSDYNIKKSEIESTLRYLDLYKFAGAVMYVLYYVLGLAEEKLIVPIDERRGKFLLDEILRGGNFGKYASKDHIVKWESPLGSFLRHVERDFLLVRYFPSESLWEPVSRVYQHFWRKWYN